MLGGEVDVDVTRLDLVGEHVALAAGVHGDVDDLADVDGVWVGDLRVGGEETRERDVEIGGHCGQGVALDDGVGARETQHGDLGGRRGFRGASGGVLGSLAAYGEFDLVSGLDVVDVRDAVQFGEVANSHFLAGDFCQGLPCPNRDRFNPVVSSTDLIACRAVSGAGGVLYVGTARTGFASLRNHSIAACSGWKAIGILWHRFLAVIRPRTISAANDSSVGESAQKNSSNDEGLHGFGRMEGGGKGGGAVESPLVLLLRATISNG